MLASDVWIEELAILSQEDAYNSVDPKSNSANVQTELYMACTCGNHRRIATYKICINKQLKYQCYNKAGTVYLLMFSSYKARLEPRNACGLRAMFGSRS